ncbi:hypothetical protein K8T06_00660 [bacterium]|nr:hypothetical protein [bacterium]
MSQFKYYAPSILLLLLSVCVITPVDAEKISRKNIDVVYQYRQVTDGFGNIRKVHIQGYVKNNDRRIASKINVSFKLVWQNRHSDIKKLHFTNLPENKLENFKFNIDLGTQPAVINSIICNISSIKFSKQREATTLTSHHLVLHDFYSLARLNEEGKAFQQILDHIRKSNVFRIPLKGEFETTNEFESRLNEAENDHFSRIMDDLENQYGHLLGGQNTIVRFLPRFYKNALVYLSECSSYFQVPFRLGKYNADFSRFEKISMIPRTYPFPLETKIPETEINIIHKTGMFFLRKNKFPLDRDEARLWRKQDKNLALEIVVRNGVIQDGPYFRDFCVVENIQLKNIQTGRILREWFINP